MMDTGFVTPVSNAAVRTDRFEDNLLFGLAVAACTDGNEARILVRGIVRNEGWSGLTVGGAVYLGESDGALTQTVPSTSNDAVQIIGWALSDSEIYFDFSRPYQLVE